METKKTLVALGVLFTMVNGSLALAANEPFKNFYSGFGVEDPDPDLDGVTGIQDKCPGSPFDLLVINKSVKKKKVAVQFSDPSTQAPIYLRVKTIHSKDKHGDNAITIQTASSDKFTGADVKTYTLQPNKIGTIDSIGKRMRVLYSSSQSGTIVTWVAGLEGTTKKGCLVDEYTGGGNLQMP